MIEIFVALGLVLGMTLAHEIGFRVGGRFCSTDDALDRQIGLIRASTAGLVAFLIGFAFSGAASRSIDRLDIAVKEANALGTAYLRADALSEPGRGELKAALKQYTADRVQLVGQTAAPAPILARVSNLHQRMWRAAISATQNNAPLMAVALPPINEVIDLHATHLAAARRHLPVPLMYALLGSVAVSIALIGFANGRLGRRFSLLDAVYSAVLAVALWMTIDLDYPNIGVFRGNNQSYNEALETMR